MNFEKYQLERLIPEQIYSGLADKPIVYIPLGAIEWHGLHLPIGLDSMTSHGLCLRVAATIGGLVMPPLYYGMTGSIGHHPWTILLEQESTFLAILRDTLARLEAFDVKLAVVFTGHFGKRQLVALEILKKEWAEGKHTMKLLVLSIHQCPEATMIGDHGAVFETSLLTQLHSDLVHLDKLPDLQNHPANDPEGDSWGVHRRDPDNVLFGILGDDPRLYEEGKARILIDVIYNWLKEQVNMTFDT